MIIVQTPLRVSLFGGGTDFRSFFERDGGTVLTMAIDKYIFVTIKKRFDRKFRIGYTRTEMVDRLDDIEHELIRESLRKTGISGGVEITTMGDIPAAGTGLGSSSSVTVGSLLAMYSYLGETVTAEQLAREACHIEIDILKKPIGIQDQYIAAYGGLRLVDFLPDGQVKVERVNLNNDCLRKLNENLLLFFTGVTRDSSTILSEQQANIDQKRDYLNRLRKMAYQARYEVEAGNIDVIGEMLDESWKYKKSLASNISNNHLDDLYTTAINAGAAGGKISGAGGGGFLLLYCPHEKQQAVRTALSQLQELPFQMENYGSKVIFNYVR